jgi:hypothetical protein
LTEYLPFAVLNHRIRVGLSQEFLLDQDLEVRWKGPRELHLVKLNGPHVLSSPPEKLFFSFTLHHVLPDRNHHTHEDPHDHENNGDTEKNVPAFASLGRWDGYLRGYGGASPA